MGLRFPFTYQSPVGQLKSVPSLSPVTLGRQGTSVGNGPSEDTGRTRWDPPPSPSGKGHSVTGLPIPGRTFTGEKRKRSSEQTPFQL